MLIRRRRRRFSWAQLAVEVFVVVLGVTLALGANELRQRFVDRREARVALQGIAGEMAFNCTQLSRTKAYHDRLLAELDSVRAAQPSVVNGDASMSALQALPAWHGYDPAFVTSAAYETAQATGAFGLLPYERALGLGRYYTFVGLYQETVRQSLGVILETGRPTVAQVEIVLRLTSELQRELAPQSCEGARQLRAEVGEPAAS